MDYTSWRTVIALFEWVHMYIGRDGDYSSLPCQEISGRGWGSCCANKWPHWCPTEDWIQLWMFRDQHSMNARRMSEACAAECCCQRCLMSVGKRSPAPLSLFHSGSVCKQYPFGLLLCANSGISPSSCEEASLPKRPGSVTIENKSVLLALQSLVITSVLEARGLRKKILNS